MQAPLDSSAGLSLYDARPFFEKALQHGLQHHLIDPQKLDTICTDAPKGMVQIARYFGTEFLRPELEKAKDRLVNLVSLSLEAQSGGDVQRAAEMLRDHSLLSRSKVGSDMLKALIAMPQNSHFGMNESGGFTDDHIPQLAKWSLRSLADYQAELAKRQHVSGVIDAAVWLADELGTSPDDLEDEGKDAEAVIRSALLALATGRSKLPNWPAFDAMVASLRQKYMTKPQALHTALAAALPEDLPPKLRPAVLAALQSVCADMPKILDPTLATRRLFDQTPAFMGRYFWFEDGLAEVDHHARQASSAWDKITGGNSDDGSLLTLFFCAAAHAAPKTLLTEKSANTLLRKIQKAGFRPEAAFLFIADHAPAAYQSDYAQLWTHFVEEASGLLQSDAVGATNDALALLRRECNVK